MINNGGFRVPRSRAFQTHQAMRETILQALEPVLFGDMPYAYEVRRQFEEAFAAVVQQKHAVAVHSGTIGLFLALRACQIGLDDEVITVGNSDISTTAAIHQCGATPVICDVLESDFTVDPSLVEASITDRTRAILPVDLYGHPADVKSLRAVADRHDLLIIEDAALAVGAMDYGKPVGTYADATVFSFAPYKPLGSVGNGAMVVTGNQWIAEQLHLLTHYGHASDPRGLYQGRQRYIAEGYNVPLDGLQAALLNTKLPYLTEWTAKRRYIAQAYADGLAYSAARLPSFRPESEPTFRTYTICVENQQAIYQSLLNAGIEAVLHYSPAIYQHEINRGMVPSSAELPVTDRLATELICLPVTPELTEEDIAYVVDVTQSLLPK